MNWQQIIKNSVQKQKELLEAAKNEGRAFSDAEQKSFDDLQAKIENAQKMLELENKAAANAASVPTTPTTNSDDIVPMQNVTVKNSPPKWNGIGDMLQAVRNHALTGNLDDRFQNAALGGNETVPSDGGFLVGETMAQDVLKRTYETSVLAPRCRQRSVTNGNRYVQNYIDETSRADGSRYGGVQGYWVAEAGTITASKPKLGKIELELQKLAGLYYATDELLEDAPLLAQDVANWYGEEFGFKIDDAIFRGNGTGKPTGFLNSNALIEVAKESGQAADTIVYENIVKMWSRMYARSRATSAWFINQEIEPQLNTMAQTLGTSGVTVYLPAGGLSEAPYATLYGRPVIPIEHASALGDVGDIVLADMNQYLLVDKANRGIKQARSIHVAFVTDQEAFRFTIRVNGQSIWQSPLSPYKGAKTLSPFVALAERA